MKEKDLAPIDRLIVRVIRKSKGPMSTYRISKKAKLSWSTINAHCYKLMSIGILDSRVESNPYGQKRVLWRVKRRFN